MNGETKMYMSSFGKNLRSIRANLSFTLDEIAQLSSIDRKQLEDIEAGAGNPSLTTLINLARAYNINLFELFLLPDVECKAKQGPVSDMMEIRKQDTNQRELRLF